MIGLQVETALSSERAQLEDRVDARVTRDVLVNGRVAIPAGSRVFGSVTLVDRGGKVKGAARLGIRFHTLVLADGSEVALNTEPFYREGESPAGDSAKKIGGATAVGAILGGILGGGKGAVIGGATGAAGGTAAAMAGDRNAAVVPAGIDRHRSPLSAGNDSGREERVLESGELVIWPFGDRDLVAIIATSPNHADMNRKVPSDRAPARRLDRRLPRTSRAVSRFSRACSLATIRRALPRDGTRTRRIRTTRSSPTSSA